MNFFSGSRDSRYFVCNINKELIFSREEKILWKKRVREDDLKVIGVGNNGLTAVLYDEGIRIYGPGEKEPEEFVEKFSKTALSARSSYLTRAILKDSGTQICMDIISNKSKGPEKIFPSFGQPKTPKVVEFHEIIFYSIPGKNHEIFYRYEQPKDQEARLGWNISRDFNYIAIAEPLKKTGGKRIKFSVVHTPSYEAHLEILLKDAQINHMLVNEQGFSLLDITSEGKHELFVAGPDGKRFNISPPEDYEILHLGGNFVAILAKATPSLLIKSFEDNIICNANLKALNDLNIPYALLFNAKDNIDLVYLLDDEIKILHSDVDRIQVDTKRWDILGKRATYSPAGEQGEVQQKEEKQIPIDQDAIKHEKDTSGNGDRRSVYKSSPREDILRSLENIRVEYIMGQINEEEYKKTKEKLEKDLASLELDEMSGQPDTETFVPTPDPKPVKMESTLVKNGLNAPERREVKKEDDLSAPTRSSSKGASLVNIDLMTGMELPTLELEPKSSPVAKPSSMAKELPVTKEDPVIKETTVIKDPALINGTPGVKQSQPVKESYPVKTKHEPEVLKPDKSLEEKLRPAEKPEKKKVYSDERQKLEKLLDVLEERLMVGLISEPTYDNLREKYSRALEIYNEE